MENSTPPDPSNGWRTIDSAPRDGQRFLIWDGWHQCLASFDRGKYLATHGRTENNKRTSDHDSWLWHPLPKDPQ